MDQQLAPQVLIEQQMQSILKYGNYEAAYLFSREGLPIARVGNSSDVDPDRLAEMSIMFQDVQRLTNTLGGIDNLKEVFVEGNNFRKVVFRFFPAFGEEVVLAVVIPPRKTYRKHTNDLQRLIHQIEF
jgi:predicted regulator of Ras-like GTPase activity (Roadblock/LC7/MglB family)